MRELSELKDPILEVIYGHKKSTVWIDHDGGMIKLGTFVDRGAAELFIEYFKGMGITIDVYDFGGEENERV